MIYARVDSSMPCSMGYRAGPRMRLGRASQTTSRFSSLILRLRHCNHSLNITVENAAGALAFYSREGPKSRYRKHRNWFRLYRLSLALAIERTKELKTYDKGKNGRSETSDLLGAIEPFEPHQVVLHACVSISSHVQPQQFPLTTPLFSYEGESSDLSRSIEFNSITHKCATI